MVNSFDKDSVSILGLSFKPNTPVITDSPSIALIENLLSVGKNINVYDVSCIREVKDIFGDRITYSKSVENCVTSGEIVVVMLECDEYSKIKDDWSSFDEHIILDCWRFLDKDKFKKFTYKSLGVGNKNV